MSTYQPLTDMERHTLRVAVPALDLPELPETASDIDLFERAHALGYGEIAPRSEPGLRALLKILGVIPTRESERFDLIKLKQQRKRK